MELELDVKDLSIIAIMNFMAIFVSSFFHVPLLFYALTFVVCSLLSFVYVLAMSEIHKLEETQKLRALFQ
jgi:membrane protein implicated in regulation of membrane protease activity